MFGNIRRKRKKEQEREQKKQNEFQQAQTGQFPTKEEVQEMHNRADEMTRAEQGRQDQNRERYKEEAKKDLGTEMQGLTPAQRQAMQETASKQISGQVQNASRLLSSKMGRQGVRGGAANAMQSELVGQGLEARNQFLRDLTEKDADLAMQKLAAYLTSVEGRTAQDLLNRQQSIDYLVGEKDRRRESAMSNFFNRYYGKV